MITRMECPGYVVRTTCPSHPNLAIVMNPGSRIHVENSHHSLDESPANVEDHVVQQEWSGGIGTTMNSDRRDE